MQRLVMAVLVRVVQGRFLGVFFGVGREAVSGVAVVGGLLVVAFFRCSAAARWFCRACSK
ncbi:hypothetical protein ACFQT0_27475 [Hymenobacter humi]|uniref:Uncharacterized protein n=1 Tax=Hymenobacter humi TaxID=1411620 RepID=A0ABW2UER1_9BACT